MANQIRLKRGSGSDPSASDLATGEIAVRTDNGKLFTKKDDGSVAEISGGGGVTDGDKGDITVSNDGATFTIDNNAVTLSKMANNSVDTDELVTGAVTNAKVNASAAIAGSKISPDFGSQDITTTGHVDLPDDSKIKLGTGDDLQIYHNTVNYIDSAATQLRIDTDVLRLRTDAGEHYLEADANSAVKLFYDNSKKFETTSSGGTLTGNLAVTGTVDGRDVATDGTKLDGIESNATADQTASDIRSLGFFDTNNDGAGSGLDSDLLDGIHGSQFLRSDAADTADGDITFDGGSGAVTLAAGSDIRFTNGDWTGNACKIQRHSDALYIQGGGGTNQIIFRANAGNNRWIIKDNGDFVPGDDSTVDIGTSSVRVANGYFDTLYGDGSNITGVSASDNTKLPLAGGTLTGSLVTNEVRPASNNTHSLGTSLLRWSEVFTNDLHLSNEGSSNSVDGTWGDWTIQEGEDKVFMLNNRNGKKYAINLTEIV